MSGKGLVKVRSFDSGNDDGNLRRFFWIFLVLAALPIMVVYHDATDAAEEITNFVGERYIPFILQSIMFFSFLWGLLFFHVAVFRFGRGFSESTLRKIVRCVDYIWYIFGSIVVSLFAVQAIETQWIHSEFVDMVENASGSYANAVSELGRNEADCLKINFRDQSAGGNQAAAFISGYCNEVVIPHDLGVNLQKYCYRLISDLDDQQSELSRYLRPMNSFSALKPNAEPVSISLKRGCETALDNVFLADQFTSSYMRLAKFIAPPKRQIQIFNANIESPEGRPPFFILCFAAMLAALKVTKVSFDIFGEALFEKIWKKQKDQANAAGSL